MISLTNEQSTDTFDYTLDPVLIADKPAADRDRSRLLIYHRKTGKIAHQTFASLPDQLGPADLIVLNDTRVFPARLRGTKRSAGAIEMLLLHPVSGRFGPGSNRRWEVLIKGKADPPVELCLEGGATAQVIRNLDGGRREIVFHLPEGIDADLYAFLERWGEIPLPPYILKKRERTGADLFDRSRYQTVYASNWGSAAAPTAGLHFTEGLLGVLEERGITRATVTLHIGLDTFQPIRTEKLRDHPMHREWFHVPSEAAEAINATRKKGGRVIAVGTTVTRALESASRPDGTVESMQGETDLFITPGYRFKAVDGLITNFHLPKSTLLVLVSAFAGCDEIRSVYQEAIQMQYRFYSYGDAMLIL